MKNLLLPGLFFIVIPFLLASMFVVDDYDMRLSIGGWTLLFSFVASILYIFIGSRVAWKKRHEYINDGTLTEDEADLWYIRYWGYDFYNYRMQSDQNKRDRARMKEIKKKIRNRKKK